VRFLILLDTLVSVAKLLNDMPLDRANRLYLHPIHQDTYKTLVSLIANLRQCRSFEDFHHFQQTLLEEILKIQGHGQACARVAKRLRKGRTVPADAPELRSGEDIHDPGSWELEADVCERVERQLRSIADALAWRVFNYDRPVIVALSRNELAGPMIGKEGLEAERGFVLDTWRDDGNFVLLHDPTTCLRIGDATEFKPIGTHGWEAYLHEIKKDPNRKRSTQRRRTRLAEEAIRDGGPLPNDPEARLVTLDVPYKTHLPRLRDAFRLAAERGVVAMKVPGGRTLVVADVRQGYQLWSEQEFIERTNEAQVRALKRAGIHDVGHHVHYDSYDMTARSPIQPPWAIYPLPPIVCANLIVDMAVYFVTISSVPLLEALRAAGIAAEWVLPSGQRQLQRGDVILRAYKGSRGMEMKPSDMQRLLLELVDLTTWVETVKELLTRDNIGNHPWPYYRDEHRVWR